MKQILIPVNKKGGVDPERVSMKFQKLFLSQKFDSTYTLVGKVKQDENTRLFESNGR